MVHFFIGTKAQFIKMAPVMAEMQKRGLPFRLIDSGQHAELSASVRSVFGLPEPAIALSDEKSEVIRVGGAIKWYLKILRRARRDSAWLKNEVFPGGGICVIHGDTLSTLLGLQLAKRAKMKVAHVESGLTSRRRFEPFPEQLIRMFVMKRADVLFAPGEQAAWNLTRMRVRGKIVDTGRNKIGRAHV